jgi:general secretion pathway protein D
MLSTNPRPADRRPGPSVSLDGSPLLAGARVPAGMVLVLVCLLTGGCAASTASHHGLDAERVRDYDRAVVEYTKALRLSPGDIAIRKALERVKLRASEEHFQRARRLGATGKFEEALVEYEIAAELNPTNSAVDEELRLTRNQLRAKISVGREGKTRLQTLVERTRDLPPPGLELPQNVRMPTSLVFREAMSREVFLAIARYGEISLIFDPAFRDTTITAVDLRNASLEDALNAVAGATRTFFRVTAPRTVEVIPDTPAKRREYEEEVVRTFYLSNADLKETMDLLRLVIDLRRIAPTSANNALTIKDTPERIAAAARVLSAIDKARPEVIIDVELLEVDRTKELEYGLDIASPATGGNAAGLNGSASIDTGTSGTINLRALRSLTQSDVLLANLPALYYRLLRTDTNTRTLANPQLRTTEGTVAQARFGDRVPVPITTFAPIATGGTPQQPITSYQYENIGVNIDITPRTHHDDDVTLAVKVAVTSVSGTGFGNLPTFGNREITTNIRLRDGETNMLAGLIRDDERTSLAGIPGLTDIPVVGRLFGHTQKSAQQTDIILTLTPHIIRVLDLTEADLRPFRVGRDSLAPLTELPLAPEPPRPELPPAPAAVPPAAVPPATAPPGPVPGATPTAIRPQ